MRRRALSQAISSADPKPRRRDARVYRDGGYPRGLGPVPIMPLPLPTTGRLDPTPDAAAAGAWKEVPVGGLRSRRPCPIAVARAAAMSRVPAASVERIRRPMTIPPCGAAGEWRIPKCGQGTEIADARVPEGNPRTVRSCEPQGSRGGSVRGLLGLETAPRLSSRHPRPVFCS